MKLPSRLTDLSADSLALTVAALLAVLVSVPALGSVPMWDGQIYANCLLDVAYGDDVSAIACAQHPTQAYLGALLPGQMLAPGSSVLLHLSNLALHVVALAGLGKLLRACLPGDEHMRLRGIALCAAAVHPVALGAMFNMNPDNGVYAFSLMLLGATIGSPARERVLPAFLAALALCFSKETGIPVALVIAAGAMFAAPHWRNWRGVLALGVPPVLAIGWISWARLSGTQEQWAPSGPGTRFLGFAPFAWGDPTFSAYMIGIFLLGFGWLVTSAWLADAIVGLTRLVKRLPLRRPNGMEVRTSLVVGAIAVVVTGGLTTYHTFNHMRYFLVLFPIWLVVGVLAVVRLGLPARSRELVVGGWAAAFLLASWTSVDPVARAIYGTFDAGGARMYLMTSFTGECCGRGQDQLVYNLQYTGFSLAQDKVIPKLPPNPESVIAGPGPVNWSSFAQLDTKDHTRTLRRRDAYLPIFTEHFTVLINRHRVPEFWFIDMPNSDNERFIGMIKEFYDERETIAQMAHGVRITARKFIRR